MDAARRLWQRSHGCLIACVALALGLAFALRIPWLGSALGNDEGGLAYIAGAWHDGGPFPYGDYFIDRPPVLLLVYRLAALTGGTATVRTIGVIAVLALVVATTLLARELGGDRAAGWAALMTAVLGSSVALGSVFTPAELIAVLPSTLSVLLLWKGIEAPAPRLPLLFAAGALAVGALLVKQSFGDALLAGIACLAAAPLLDRARRRPLLAGAGAYLGGTLAALLALELWEHTTAIPDGRIYYSLLEFRLDGLSALAGSAGSLPGRFAGRLLPPVILSGLIVVLVWSLAGIRRLRPRRVLAVTLSAWGIGGAVGVLAGGSYWAHYLIQLIPFAAVTASLALASASARSARISVALLAACTAGGFLLGPAVLAARSTPSAAIGDYIHDNARPRDTAYVLYSQADVLYYSGLRDPFPYNWSLMMRTVPRAQHELRAMLSSPRRPTWIVAWEPPNSYGLDRSGRTRRLLDRHYHQVAELCGRPILLRVEAPTPRSAPSPVPCG